MTHKTFWIEYKIRQIGLAVETERGRPHHLQKEVAGPIFLSQTRRQYGVCRDLEP